MHPTHPSLDARLRAGTGYPTIGLLVELWTDHTPATSPAPATCPTCGHLYTPSAPYCPTAATVRTLLRRRRYETPLTTLLDAMTFSQYRDLIDPVPSTKPPADPWAVTP